MFAVRSLELRTAIPDNSYDTLGMTFKRTCKYGSLSTLGSSSKHLTGEKSTTQLRWNLVSLHDYRPVLNLEVADLGMERLDVYIIARV